MNSSASHSRPDPEEFLPLLIHHQRQIYGFILSLVPNRHDADDLLQETTVTMWRKHESYERGTDFLAWALTIARIEVLRHRQRHARSRLLFSDDMMERLADEVSQSVTDYSVWQDALASCLKRLSQSDKELIQLKYQDSLTTKDIAKRLGRPVQGMYKVMARIHAALADCAKRRVKEGLA